MSLISKKPKLTEQDIEDLRQEISHFTQLVGGLPTSEPIKRLLKILDETRENTVNDLCLRRLRHSTQTQNSGFHHWHQLGQNMQVIDGIKKKYISMQQREGYILLEEFNKIVQ